MQLDTKEFRLTRQELALFSAGEYLRAFWWFVAVSPAFGILAIAIGNRLMQIVGLFAIAWPFSIPARAALITSKPARLFTNGCYVKIDPEALTFYGTEPIDRPLRWRIPWGDVRDISDRGSTLVLRFFKWGFAPIPKRAFRRPEDWQSLLDAVEDMRERRAKGE